MASSAGKTRRRVSSAVPSSEVSSKRAAARTHSDGDDRPHLHKLRHTLANVRWSHPDQVAAAWSPPSHRQLLFREEAPSYLTGNPFVLHGFRRCATLWEALDGLFYMHNATWDAWTSIGSFLHSHVCVRCRKNATLCALGR